MSNLKRQKSDERWLSWARSQQRHFGLKTGIFHSPLSQLLPMIIHSDRASVTNATHYIVDWRWWHGILCDSTGLRVVFISDHHFDFSNDTVLNLLSFFRPVWWTSEKKTKIQNYHWLREWHIHIFKSNIRKAVTNFCDKLQKKKPNRK